MQSERRFDHEKLEVYAVALEFVTWLTDLLTEVSQANKPNVRETVNQVDRASTSIVLNIAEGNGRRGTKQRAKFFDDARGSATESAACLDVLVAKRVVKEIQVQHGKHLLNRITSMLSKLVERFEK